MKKLKKTIKLTDMSTGEAREHTSYVDLMFDDTEGYLLWHNKSKISEFLGKRLPDAFTWAEKGRLAELKHYILKDNQLLAYRRSHKLYPLDFEVMMKYLDVGATQLRILLNKSKRYGVLKEVSINGAKYLAYNPIYGIKGKRVTLITFLIFQDEFIAEPDFPRWVITKFVEQAQSLEDIVKVENKKTV
jgi:hypothetical protein